MIKKLAYSMYIWTLFLTSTILAQVNSPVSPAPVDLKIANLKSAVDDMVADEKHHNQFQGHAMEANINAIKKNVANASEEMNQLIRPVYWDKGNIDKPQV